MTVDYFKAWQFAHRSGDVFTEKAMRTFIRGRAERALVKIDKELRKGQ